MKTFMFQKRSGKLRMVAIDPISIEKYAIIVQQNGKLFRFTANFSLSAFIKKSDAITVILCYVDADSKLHPVRTTPTDSLLPLSAYEIESEGESLEVIEKTNELEAIVREIESTISENEELEGILEEETKETKKPAQNMKKGSDSWKVKWEV